MTGSQPARMRLQYNDFVVQERVLEAAPGRTIADTARAVGTTPSALRMWLRRHPDFAKRFRRAQLSGSPVFRTSTPHRNAS